MKITLIGQDIPMLFPSLLTDLLFTMKSSADVAIEERNPAMQDVLQRYGDTVIRQAGLGNQLTVDNDRSALLRDADCVIYAGDLMAATRFRQDREALSGPEDDPEDPGLTEQARVNGGIGGLLHTLRQGELIHQLTEEMCSCCPKALVITLGQPVARTCQMFRKAGFACWGLGKSPLRGPGGLDGICKKLHAKPEQMDAVIAGLPGFAWLLSLKDKTEQDDLLDVARDAAEADELGRLAHRWLDWYDAIPVGDVTAHAEFLPAQEDYQPEAEPTFGESVEQRKERILYMNTVGEKGLAPAIPKAQPGEGVMAQMLLLSKAPAIRPMQLAISLLCGADLEMPAVTRVNSAGEIKDLPRDAIIEAPLTLRNGVEVPHRLELPERLADICLSVDETHRLAAEAGLGDRSALRECIEIDPALDGLDRLYIQQLVDAMIRIHSDILSLWSEDEEEL